MARLLVGLALSFVALWLVLLVLLARVRPRDEPWRDALRIVPEVVRLVARLARDPDVPRGVRRRLAIALAYNVQPINLIPDFVPVIGFADNAAVLCWALRAVVRRAGSDAVVRHWSGTEENLVLLYRVARLGPAPRLPPAS